MDSIFKKRLIKAKEYDPRSLNRFLEPDQVAALDEVSFTTILKQRGAEDSEELITYGSARQIRSLFDMDAWQGDRPNYNSLSTYFTVALNISPETLMRVMDIIDPEMLIAFLQEKVVVTQLEKDEPQPPTLFDGEQELPRFETPDGFFVIDLKKMPASDEINPLTLIDLLYREDLQLGFRTVQAIAWELPSEQEEMAYQFRSSRMEELGFLPYEEAAKLYSPLKSDDPLPPPLPLDNPVTVPSFYLKRLPEGKAFARVLESIDDAALLDRLEQELIFITNTASVVEAVEPGDIDQMLNLFIRIEGYLSLAIELFHGEDILGCAERLKHCALTWYMRKGFGSTWQLAQKAAHIEARFELAGAENLLTDTDLALIRALKQRIPGYIPRGEFLEEMAKPFTTAAQVLEVRARLSELESKLSV